MPFLAISCTTGSATIDYGVYGGNQANPYGKGTFVKPYLVKIEMASTGSHLKMTFSDAFSWCVSWNDGATDYSQPVEGVQVSVVDSVNGTAPESQEHLFQMITALMG